MSKLSAKISTSQDAEQQAVSKRRDPVPRHALMWFFIAQWCSILPLAPYLPPWLLGLGVLVSLWRWQIHRGAWSYPVAWAKHFLTLLLPLGLYWTYGPSVAMETMLSLLVAGFVLKLLELRQHQDLTLLSYLAYFVASTQLLFVETLLGSVYALLCLMIVTATLVALNLPASGYRWTRVLRLTAVLFLQAIPIMLILFFVVPRFGSMWTVPLNNSLAKTGVSEEMAPGDFSNLMRSSELAFRVTFDGEIPAPSQRYWRALVMTDFDGRRWRVNKRHSPHSLRSHYEGNPWAQAIQVSGEPVHYSVMLEPTHKEWLYVLPGVQEATAGADETLYITPAFTLYQRRPVTQRKQYQVTSYLQHQAQVDELPAEERQLALQLPDNFNPRTQAQAIQWREEAGSDAALIERLLTYFHEEFRYTLQPPLLGRHTADEFLWQTRAGFCEHFSGSFVVFLRAAGIPARVVTGYQGGKVNSNEDYLTVRQYDAHAWSEVWLEGRGWVRIDPTAAVAPERIERGVEYSLNDEDSQLLGNAFARRLVMWGRLQARWEELNYRWNLWVLSYDAETQQALFDRWGRHLHPWQIVLVLITLSLTFLLLLLAWFLWRQRSEPLHPADKAYRFFVRKLLSADVTPLEGESSRNFCQRAARQLPAKAKDIHRIGALYEKVVFAADASALPELQKKVKSLRIK